MRTGSERFLGKFQGSERLRSRYAGEVLEELIEGFTAFYVVEERLDRHSGAYVTLHAAEEVGV